MHVCVQRPVAWGYISAGRLLQEGLGLAGCLHPATCLQLAGMGRCVMDEAKWHDDASAQESTHLRRAMLAICLYSATYLQPMGWCVMHENMLQLSLTNSMLECSGCWITIVKTSSSDQPSCCRNTIARPARKILPCSRSLGWLTNTRQIWLSCRP